MILGISRGFQTAKAPLTGGALGEIHLMIEMLLRGLRVIKTYIAEAFLYYFFKSCKYLSLVMCNIESKELSRVFS